MLTRAAAAVLTPVCRLMSEALPPEACLPTRLVELHLDSLKDSMKQLTGLQVWLRSLLPGWWTTVGGCQGKQELFGLFVQSSVLCCAVLWHPFLPPCTHITTTLHQYIMSTSSTLSWSYPAPSVLLLQCLTRLQVGLLDVPPSALELLSALVSLAHISASILFPPLAGAAARLAAVLRPAPDQDLGPYLERIVSCRLPFVELLVQGAVLDPRAMQLVGQCRHLTKLQLQGCKGRMGDSWPTLDPFRCLRWVQL